VNGKPHDRLWIRHEDLANGAHVVFNVGPNPNKAFATDEKLAPPSLTA
jgi:putative alpha-1,2-mannosidase